MFNKVLVVLDNSYNSLFLLNKVIKRKWIDFPIIALISFENDSKTNELKKVIKEICQKKKLIFEEKMISFENKESLFVKYEIEKLNYKKKLMQKYKLNKVFDSSFLEKTLTRAMYEDDKKVFVPFYGDFRKMKYLTHAEKTFFIKKTFKKLEFLVFKKTKIRKLNTSIDLIYLDNEIKKIALNTAKIKDKTKYKMYKHYKMLNRSKEGERKKSWSIFKKWERTNFNKEFFVEVSDEMKELLIFWYFKVFLSIYILSYNLVLDIIESIKELGLSSFETIIQKKIILKFENENIIIRYYEKP